MWKKIFTIFIISLFVQEVSFAQFSLGNLSAGAGLSYSSYSSVGSVVGIQPRIGYDFSEKSTLIVGYNYGVSSPKDNSTINLYSIDGSNNSSTVGLETSYSFKTLFVNGQYHFIKDNEAPFGVYGIIGLSYISVSLSSKLGSFDATKYRPDITLGGEESTSGLGMHVGLGTHYKVSMLKLFGEFQLGIPPNNVQGTYYANPIPFHFIANAGVMIPFGSK